MSNRDTNAVMSWILLDSDAPRDIKKAALFSLVPDLGMSQLGDYLLEDRHHEELHKLCRDGKKIAAIKYFRGETGAGLKEAKETIEKNFGV
jgi:ribosomal protein L7/L12